MAGDLTQLERAYFVRKAGAALPTEPLNNIKRRVMAAAIGSGVNARTPMNQLEKLWLLDVIGGAARNFNSIEELWRQAVISIGQTPTAQLHGNKMKFYRSAP